MEFQLDREWRLRPIQGDTGQAFLGMREQERVFIKRNTSPLLVALSREGITPKLVWTRRMGNGDTITAQEWLEGCVLRPEEVGNNRNVVRILYRLHHSDMLVDMMNKIGGKSISPREMIEMYKKNLPEGLEKNHYLARVADYLEKNLPAFSSNNYCVVHGDVNYKNWIGSEDYLYLVDWDSVRLGDPALDLGNLLGHYVPLEEWNNWLVSYGLKPTNTTLERITWYAAMSFLNEIDRQFRKQDYKRMNNEILLLKQTFKY
ncbi:MAG: phosphotransferase family protein [Lactobacillales bacterium]|jgi:thiamine kinase-like enzyme|nr:phosphotransferase family protein [Lactobacillales bacterium]